MTKTRGRTPPFSVSDTRLEKFVVSLNARVNGIPKDKNPPHYALICTSIPPAPSDDLGSCQSILYERTRRKFLKHPNFGVDRITRAKNTGKFKIDEHFKKDGTFLGRGMLATDDFTVGDPILVERPLMVVPLDGNLSGVLDYPPDVSDTVKAETVPRCILEPMIQAAFNRLSPENQAAFMSLHNAQVGDSNILCSIWGSNAFPVPELLEEDKNTYSMVFKNVSMINHSCRANCAFYFDLTSFTMVVSATRNITSGEEILFNYVDNQLELPMAAQRQQLLGSVGLLCTCESCFFSVSESDQRRKNIQESLRQSDGRYHTIPMNSLHPVTFEYECTDRWMDEMEKEDQQGSEMYVKRLERFIKLFTSMDELATQAGVEVDGVDLPGIRAKIPSYKMILRGLSKAHFGYYSDKYRSIEAQFS